MNKQVFTIFYDGGSRPEWNASYGSYLIVSPTEGVISQTSQRLRFNGSHSSHMAEYRTLSRALSSLLKQLSKRKIVPQDVKVYIYGDSKSVQEQCNGKARCNTGVSKIMNGEVAKKLARFGEYKTLRLRRKTVEMILGH